MELRLVGNPLRNDESGRSAPVRRCSTPLAVEPPAGSQRAGSSKCPRKTILVVDDEPDLRDVVSQILLGRGYHVVQARNGVEALEAMKLNPETVSAVITDIMMPEMNGVQLGKHLARLGNSVPIIYMSGCWEDSDTAKDLARTGAPLLKKPFQIQELVGSLEKLL